MCPEDPDLQPYRALHGSRTALHPQAGPCFICEGRFLVAEALAAHRCGQLTVISVLGTPKALEGLELPPAVARLEASPEVISELAGFPFHRGLLCAAAIPTEPPETLLLEARRLLVLPRVDNVDNLGLLLRSAAALGTDGVVAGRGPGVFERRTVRVSMGAAWKLPVWRRDAPEDLLAAWRARGGEVVGAALTHEAVDARSWRPAPRTALLLGPEGDGLDGAWLARCDRTVMIPMARGMDSLNVAAAGAILLWHLSAD